MKNLKKYNYTANVVGNLPDTSGLDPDKVKETFGNVTGGSSSSSSSSSSKAPWWGIVDSLANTVTGLFDNIVKPIMGITDTKNSGQVGMEFEEKDNTLTYVIVGGIIIVAIVLIMKYAKK